MIDRSELLERAGALSLRPNVVEKDYVLGWILAAISNHPRLGPTWIFKGGTCLKKCFFETYRFSEDLDFTVTDPAQLTEESLSAAFREIAEWVYEHAGIELPADRFRFDVYRNKRDGLCCEGKVAYRGPIAPGGDLPRVKLDLTVDERVVLEPIHRPIEHDYSDRPGSGFEARCYPFDEVFAEKIRALAERGRPRDLYDVLNLFRHDEFAPEPGRVLAVLRQKCEFKGISVPTLAVVERFKAELAADWEQMLGHQLPALPPFDAFWTALPGLFGWLETGAPLVSRPPVEPLMPAAGEAIGRYQTGRLPVGAALAGTLERIRFAASNRLCVDLAYDGGVRRIEPYSLRRTGAGHVVLYALRADTKEIRSYRVDRIQGAQVTEQTFVPRYMVELTPSGPLRIPSTANRTESTARLTTPRVRHSSPGPVYVLQCMACHKEFERKTSDTKLRAHKNPAGWPCPGRSGWLVRTKYG